MKDEKKTKKQLIQELQQLRRRLARWEAPKSTGKRAEKALRYSQESFRALVENATDGILIATGKGVYVYANKGAAKITGYSIAELLDLSMKDLTHPDEYKRVAERYRKRLAGKTVPRQYETVIVRKDGQSVPIELTAAKTIWQGQPAGLAIVRDITARKRVKEALQESEERFRLAFEDGPLGMAFVALDYKLLKVNKVFCDMLGYTEKELTALTFEDITHPEDVKKDLRLADQVFKGKIPSYNIEKRYIKKNREILWADLTATVIRDQDGQALYGLAMIEDITERKQAEQMLRESERRYRTTIDSMSDIVHMVDKELRILLINPAFKRWVRLLKLDTEIVGRPLFKVFPFLTNKIRKEYRRVFKTGKSLITEEKTLIEGKEYITETRKIPVLEGGEVIRVITVIRDFTEQRQTQAALRESEEQYRTLVEESLQGLVITQGSPPRIRFANSKTADIIGLSVDELMTFSPKEMMALVHIEDQAVFQQFLRDSKARESLPAHFEFRIVRKDKIVRWVETYSTNMFYRGEPAVQTSIIDITDRKEAERKLRESEEYNRHLIQNSSDLIMVVEADGNVKDISPSVERLLGYKPEDLVDTNIFEYIHAEDAPCMQEYYRNAIKRPGITPTIEYRFRHEDGSWGYLESVGNNLLDNPVVEGLIINSRDITERKQAEEELRKYREHLEQLVEERTAELQKAYEQLKGEVEVHRKTGEALRESEERMRAFLNAPTDAAWMLIDSRGIVLVSNEAATRRLGKTMDEFLGKVVFDHFPTDVAELRKKKFDQVFQSGEPVRFEDERAGKTLDTSIYPIFDAQGEVTQVAAFSRDITERKRMEEKLRESEEKERALLNATTDSALLLDLEGNILTINEVAAERLGKHVDDLIGTCALDLFPPDLAKSRKARITEIVRSKKPIRYEDEREGIIFDNSNCPVFDSKGKVIQLAVFARDITERKRAEEALRAERDKLEIITKNIGVGLAIISKDYRTLWANEVLKEIFGNVEGKLCYTTYNQRTDVCPGCGVKKVFTTGKASVVHEQVGKDAEGHTIWSQIIATPIKDEKGNITAAHEVVVPITERKRMELTQRALQQIANAVHTTEDLDELFKTIHRELGAILNTENFFIALLDRDSDTISFPYHKDERDPYVEMLPVRKTLTGFVIRKSQPLLATKTEIERMAQTGLIELLGVVPEIWLGVPMRVRNKKIGALVVQNYEDQSAIDESDLDILKFVSGQVGLSIEHKRAEEQLKETLEELARSNAELEQFAHVASHDLQEPLQAVAMSIEIVAKRHKGKFDAQADKFITYAVDESNRMQLLVQDLLTYSRVGMGGIQLEPTDCLIVLDQTLDNLMVPIEQSDAKITHGPLPTVMGNPLHLTQLFQNLIDNAIKFRREEPPRIHVSAKRKGDEWVFAVRDNGMGFDPKHAEKIFVAFERLLDKTKHLGTGIGLAICKKIMERHGGRIWAESQSGKGATFYFTIPVMKGTSR